MSRRFGMVSGSSSLILFISSTMRRKLVPDATFCLKSLNVEARTCLDSAPFWGDNSDKVGNNSNWINFDNASPVMELSPVSAQSTHRNFSGIPVTKFLSKSPRSFS